MDDLEEFKKTKQIKTFLLNDNLVIILLKLFTCFNIFICKVQPKMYI